ncbi:MAG: ABC transporter permease [Desulfotalea sp.]
MVELHLEQVFFIYGLFYVVLFCLQKVGVSQTKELLFASLRMTVQLVLAGLALTYLMAGDRPILTSLMILLMTAFCVQRILVKNEELGRKFKIIIGASISFSGLFVLVFFIWLVVGESIFNPQYVIPIGGMILGNSMTGISIGLNHFTKNVKSHSLEIKTLTNLGVHPYKILETIVNSSIEAALIPTVNSMVGMGIVFLPGMMTGQILSGTLPMVAIMYQIAVIIAISLGGMMSITLALKLGCKTLYEKQDMLIQL